MKKIAVINDISGFGKCSLTAAMPIISAQGIQCCPLPTGVFSNQTGYDTFKSVDLTDYMQGFIDEWKKLSPYFDAILTGFIANPKQVKPIFNFIDYFKTDSTILVVDPVMGDNGSAYPTFNNDMILAIKKLVDRADVITPNLTELCIICNVDYNSIVTLDDDAIAQKIISMSKQINKKVITTGVHLKNNTIANIVYDNGDVSIIKNKKIGGSFSGTGDILSSYITARIVQNDSLKNATQSASNLIQNAIADTVKCKNYNTCDGINFEKFI